MTKKYKVLGKFIKDMSSETRDVETYLFVKDRITIYKLNINISSEALKNKIIGVNTTLNFEDKEEVKRKSYFEITLTTIVRIEDKIEKNSANIKTNLFFKLNLSYQSLSLHLCLQNQKSLRAHILFFFFLIYSVQSQNLINLCQDLQGYL